jgi:hypothetical protein
MSADYSEAEAAETCCASCGIAEVDDVKLKECDGCDLVKYCSDNCKEDHRSEHEAKCKERAAELRGEILFKQPEGSHFGDCPICCVPLPITGESTFHVCCGKLLCKGCSYASQMRQFRENMEQTCPFCRHPMPKTDEEVEKMIMKRIAANDPVALCKLGLRVLKNGDHEKAFKYWTKAAELGDATAHYQLSIMCMKGEGVEKDETKEIYHLEEAAIAGHPDARFNLACYEWNNNGRDDRAVKHYIIAANLGYDKSIQALKELYKGGVISKEVFAAALRAHHAAIKATKSPNREMAAAWARRQEVEKAK